MTRATGTSARTMMSVAALLLVCGRAGAQTTAPSWPIALQGASYVDTQFGPGVASEFFTDLGSPNASISADGRLVIFRATTNTTTSTNPGAAAIWTWNGANANVVRNTDAAFGGGAYTTGGFNNLLINGSGQIAFRDNTSTTGGLYANPGTPGRLFKVGDTAPTVGATTDPTFATFGNVMLMNTSGSAMTYATVTGGSPAVVTVAGPTQNTSGLWGGTPGALSLLVRQSDQLFTPANVAIPNVLVGSIDNGGFAYSASGKVLFTGALQGTGVNTTGSTTTGTNQGIFSTRNGFTEVIARRNFSFPDSTGAVFTSGTSTDGVAIRSVNTGSTAFDMNNAGRVVYSASLNTAAGASATTNGTTALFSDTGGTHRTIARGTFATGAMTNLGAGLTWGNIFSTPVINGAGTVAFVNTSMSGTDPLTNIAVTTSANAGVFKMDSAGVFTKVMRTGDAAPAWPAVLGNPALGQVIAGAAPVFSGTPSSLAMNASGQMAFVAGLGGIGINATASGNNSGLFGVDTDGSIFLIAQKGMLYHVGPGDDRIISSAGLGGIFSGGNQDGRATSLSDTGDLVFTLQFSDTVGGAATSSGVFYAHIPAPGSATLLGIVGLLAARRRR